MLQYLHPDPLGEMPNSTLPLIVAVAGIDPRLGEHAVHELLLGHGWEGTWTYTVYDYWHYHATGHEVLVCIAGHASIGFGGDSGVAVEMRPGDAVIIPAGVGHKRLSGTADFQVVGAYPPGQNGAITRAGAIDLVVAARAIGQLELPETDPLSGEAPGRLAAWR